MESREAQFFAKLMSSYEQVLVYEDSKLQDLYHAQIPVVELQTRAEKIKLEKWEKDNKNMSSQDCLVIALLKWFKGEFFLGFTRTLKCDDCQKQGAAIGGGLPTAEERRWGGYRVELYQCPNCRKVMRFPRYNHPEKLLETRIGRCGEWANAFTMCCIAIGFKTRYVVAWFDHVWTEVFSEAQQRWLHCDPCEAICDRPLLYEAGWNRKLSYVFAFSKDQIMDVTWRYSNQHEEVLQRRKECRESWLVQTISKFNKSFLDALPIEQRKIAEIRNIKELVSFLSKQKNVSEEEKQGRTSGGVEWRKARGENGDVEIKPGYVFKPTEEDIKTGRMRVRYSTKMDAYYRNLDDNVKLGEHDIQGWRKGVYTMTSVCRKEEYDWKMAYLAREEGVKSAKITWLIDASECAGFEINEVSIRASFTTFQDGKVKMELTEDKEAGIATVLSGGSNSTIFKSSGHPVIKLTAYLQCEKNDQEICWQHSQLFREPLDNYTDFPLDITVTLKPKT